MEKEFVPYGSEWQKELKSKPKDFLVNFDSSFSSYTVTAIEEPFNNKINKNNTNKPGGPTHRYTDANACTPVLISFKPPKTYT